MRFVLFPLIVLMLTAGIAIAQKQEKTENPKESIKKERVVRIRSGKYSRMLISMLQKSSRLDLTDQQKIQVREIRTKYIAPIVKEETESRVLQRKFMNQLHKSDFDPAELKTVIKEADEFNAKIADMFIDGLAAFRDAVGQENYAKLTPVSRIDRNTLIKLKEVEMARTQKLNAEQDVKKESESKLDESK